jgi:farnesyl-diphosphate farnesyltransferase
MAPPLDTSLDALLKATSRSFHKTLRILPKQVRPQIGLAYLLARTSDTIADTELVPLDQRLAALENYRQRVLGESKAPLDFGALSRAQGSPAEAALLERSEESLAILEQFEPADLAEIRTVLRTIIGGQQLDLVSFARATKENVLSLRSAEELDDYTYRVAGCVGEFWTKMCRRHLFPDAPLDEALLMTNGVRFGKGLQLVNILRDLPADLRQGRCYLPGDSLAASGLSPRDLLEPNNEPKLRSMYNQWLDRAEGHLQAGWEYTNAIPRGQWRVRLACAWPVLIGLDTLRLLRHGRILAPEHRIKITRSRVKQIILSTVLRYPFPNAWQKLAP